VSPHSEGSARVGASVDAQDGLAGDPALQQCGDRVRGLLPGGLVVHRAVEPAVGNERGEPAEVPRAGAPPSELGEQEQPIQPRSRGTAEERARGEAVGSPGLLAAKETTVPPAATRCSAAPSVAPPTASTIASNSSPEGSSSARISSAPSSLRPRAR
jgi:hypothetical protein